jgi:hypothetical protein
MENILDSLYMDSATTNGVRWYAFGNDDVLEKMYETLTGKSFDCKKESWQKEHPNSHFRIIIQAFDNSTAETGTPLEDYDSSNLGIHASIHGSDDGKMELLAYRKVVDGEYKNQLFEKAIQQLREVCHE